MDEPSCGCPVWLPVLEVFQSFCLFSAFFDFFPVFQLLTLQGVALGPDGGGRDGRSWDQLCGSARRRAGETGAGPACSGHTVSSWQGRSWELFSGKRMGGSASHRRAHTHTQTRTHNAYKQRRTTFVCLPPIRSLCFLSPHCERCCGSPSFPQNARR